MRSFFRSAPACAPVCAVLAMLAAASVAPTEGFAQARWGTRWAAGETDPDPAVRRGVADEMGRLAPPDVRITPRLSALLNRDSDPSVLLAAVSALAGNRHPESMRALTSQVNATHTPPAPEVRAAVCRALTGVTTLSTLNALSTLDSWSQSPMVTDAAARALAALPAMAFAQRMNDARAVNSRFALMLHALALRGDPRLGGQVREVLRTPTRDRGVLLAAIDTIARLHMVEGAREVTELVQNSSTDLVVRQAALRTLGTLGTPGDRTAIRGALADTQLRTAALDACAALGDATFVPDVAGLLQAPWLGDRRAAAETLASMGGATARRALLDRLAQETDDTSRADLWHALSRFAADGDGVSSVMRTAAITSQAGRWAALEWLQRGGALDDLTVAPRPEDASSMMLAGWFGRERATREGELRAAEVDVRLAAALSFTVSHDAAGATALAAQLAREDDESVRVALLQALANVGGDVARGAVLRLLELEYDVGSEQPSIVAALHAAADLGTHDALPFVHRALWSANPHQRLAAVRGTVRLGDTAGRAALIRLVRFDPLATVRGAASLALASLAGARAWEPLRDLNRIAWTELLLAQVTEALQVARGLREWTPFVGGSVVRISGAPARSIWVMALPDGTERIAVASGDGEVMMTGAPTSGAMLVRM